MCKQRNINRWKNKCKTCGGKGWIKWFQHGEETPYRHTCPDCKGTGAKKNG